MGVAFHCVVHAPPPPVSFDIDFYPQDCSTAVSMGQTGQLARAGSARLIPMWSGAEEKLGGCKSASSLFVTPATCRCASPRGGDSSQQRK